MYSPKINEDLVKKLYQLKIKLKQPITVITNEILQNGIKKLEAKR